MPAFTQYMFFLICDLPWLQLIILTTGSLLLFISICAAFFYIAGGISEQSEDDKLSFWICFVFSFQTVDQIGYGMLSPITFECDFIVSFTSLLANFL